MLNIINMSIVLYYHKLKVSTVYFGRPQHHFILASPLFKPTPVWALFAVCFFPPLSWDVLHLSATSPVACLCWCCRSCALLLPLTAPVILNHVSKQVHFLWFVKTTWWVICVIHTRSCSICPRCFSLPLNSVLRSVVPVLCFQGYHFGDLK